MLHAVGCQSAWCVLPGGRRLRRALALLCSALLCWRGRADGGRSDSAECEPTGAREARLERLLACVRDFLREAV
jgi:hypothetical protein